MFLTDRPPVGRFSFLPTFYKYNPITYILFIDFYEQCEYNR